MDKPEKTRERLFLIDGYALIYRAYYAMISRPLTTSKGENTSAAFGLTRFLMKIRDEYEPDYLGVVMDAGTSAREELYPEYKATREKMPDELRASLPRIRELLRAFRIPVLELDDHEADDVIGTLARKAAEEGLEAVIVSGDKDFYQLITDGISLLNPGRGGPAGVDEEWVDTRNASERLGVPPERVTDYLALIGDSSDNIPGARGIGPKTAVKLIDAHGGVAQILEHADDVSGKRAREALQEYADQVELSKRLVTIMTELPIELDLDALRLTEPDQERLRQVFLDLEFHNLLRELAAPEPETETLAGEYTRVRTTAAVADLVEQIREQGGAALNVEGSDADPMRAELVGIGLAVTEGDGYYLPLGHHRPGELALDDRDELNLPPLHSPGMRPLVEVLEDAEIAKTGRNLKYDVVALRRAGIELRGVEFDVPVASYVIDPGRREHDIDALAMHYMSHRSTTRSDLCGTGRSFTPLSACDVEEVTRYAAEDADLAIRLRGMLETELERHELERLFREMEMPLVPVLADMEHAGIRIDTEFFAEQAAKLERELGLIQEDIFKEAGGEFNINSTPQLREVMFEELELPVIKKTKTGPSTDASVLEELASQGHRLPTLILEYRQLDKLKGTYVDALPLLVHPETGRIHTSFNQTVAATGRLSSSDPNLQNIPIRTQLGAELRKGFVPADGCRFVSADYSQIELRVLAHLSGDEAFVEAFRTGADIHKRTAALVFDTDTEAVTPRMRAAAKTINFATIYGIGPHALSKQLDTSYQEAKQFIESYFERLPRVRAYLDSQIEMAKEKGYVETVSGRRRYIPEVRSKNYNVRQFGERAATNAPVQGSAADIIKIAMIEIHRELERDGAGARMLLQVHDELVFEAPADEAQPLRDMVRARMEAAFELDVPLEVATGVGDSWFECK